MNEKPTLSQAKLEQLEYLATVAEQADAHRLSVIKLRIVAYEATCRAEQAEVKSNAAWARYIETFDLAAQQHIADCDAVAFFADEKNQPESENDDN